jgi:hypothetical protein
VSVFDDDGCIRQGWSAPAIDQSGVRQGNRSVSSAAVKGRTRSEERDKRCRAAKQPQVLAPLLAGLDDDSRSAGAHHEHAAP